MKNISFFIIVFCLFCSFVHAQDITPVYKKGNKVFIPVLGDEVVQKNGAIRLRELVTESGLWQVVDREEDSHFIFEFLYSEEGRDHAIVNMKDKNGTLIYQTPKYKDAGQDNEKKGRKMAEELFRKYIKRINVNATKSSAQVVPSSLRKKGIIVRPEFGASYTSNSTTLIPTCTFAFQFNPIVSVGSGLGWLYESFDFGTRSYLVYYANARAYFCDRPLSPYFDAKLGLYNDNVYVYYSLSVGMQYKKFDIGISYSDTGKSTFLLNIGYNLQFGFK